MTTPSLTDRYLAAVIRRLPESRRAAVADELRTALTDDIEARLAGGTDADTAERDALTALGDPDRLAARYTGAPLHLIGPAVYLDWRRLLTLLLSTVLPAVAGALVLTQLLAGASAIDILLGVVGTVVSVGIALSFWVTVVFAIIERTGAGDRPLRAWSPDDLPTSAARPQVGIDVLIGGVLGLLFLAVGLVAQQTWPAFRDTGGEPIPFLAPELWAWWIPYFVVVFVAELVFAIVLYRRRAWSVSLAVVNAVITLAFAIPMIALLVTDAVVNPVFSAQVSALLAGEPELVMMGGQAAIVIAVAVAIVSVFEIIDGVRKAARA